MLIDQLQQVRMFVIWPLVVGSVAFLAIRLLLKLASPVNRVNRTGMWACAASGAIAAVTAASISRDWDNSLTYWLSFTVGLAGLAIVLVLTVAIHAVEDFNANA